MDDARSLDARSLDRTHTDDDERAPERNLDDGEVGDGDADVVPALAGEVLSLFTDGPLASLAFPGLDAGVLVAARDAVRARHAHVVEAQAALARREAALVADTAALVRLAERALSYARVFADGEGDHALLSRLDAAGALRDGPRPLVVDGRAGARPSTKRRGRPPKSAAPIAKAPDPE